MVGLTSALVLLIASCVLALPQPYGIKGGTAGSGAGAIAGSAAGAGVFSGLGLPPIPIGAGGFSGSFSKSASSSFASSSASSESISFSGSGGLGLSADGLTNGGCRSGNCPNGNVDGSGLGTGSHGSSLSGAHSLSVAGSGSLTSGGSPEYSSTPCQENCPNQPSVSCKGNGCAAPVPEKCSSVECGSSQTDDAGATDDDSNDIQVNTGFQLSKKPLPHNEKPCVSESCIAPAVKPVTEETELPAYPPVDQQNNSPDTKQSPKCNSPNCGGSPYKPTNSGPVQPPSLFISTPKESPPLNGKPDSYSPERPSSYNVPILPNTNYPVPSSGCASGKCDSEEPRPNQYGHSVPNNSYNKQTGKDVPKKCSSPGCQPPRAKTPDNAAPNVPYQPSPTGFSPTPTGSDCAYGNCGNNPSNTGSGVDTSGSFYSGYSSNPRPSGYSGKPSCSQGNCGNNSPQSNNADYPQIPNNPQTPGGNGCSSGYCSNYPSSAFSGAGQTSLPFTPNPSQPSLPGQEPIQGCSNGNCGTTSSAEAGVHISGYDNRPVFPVQPYGSSTGCNSGNCRNSQTPSTSSSINPGYSNYHIPSEQPAPENQKGCSGGQCGTQPSYPTYPTGAGPATTSAPHIPSYNCPGGQCGGSFKPKPETNAPAPDSFVPLTPTSTYSSKSHKESVYTGGFGGPVGILKPNDFSVPSKVSVQVSSGVNNVAPVHSAAPSEAPKGSYKPHAEAPVPAIQPTHHHPVPNSPHYDLSGSSAVAGAAAGASSFSYSGGFGGPPGLLKPYDGGKGNVEAHASQHGTAQPGANGNHQFEGGNSAHGSGSLAGSAAQAGAVAGAGNYNGGFGYGGNNEGKIGHSGGCNGGCGGSISGSHGLGFGASGSFGLGSGGGLAALPKVGLDVLAGGLHHAAAGAKSLAGAIGSSGGGSSSFGLTGSFAASSATASSGAATKGSYGKR